MSQARLIASDVLDCALITYQVSILCRSQMRNWSYIGSWRPGKKQCTAQNKDRIRQNSQQSPSICLSLRAEKFSKHQIEQGRSEEESGFSVWVTYFETRAWTCGEGVLVLRWCLRRVPYLNVLTFTNSYMLQARKWTIVTIAYELPRASKE